MFERIGGNMSINVNIQIIAATNRDLEALIREGKFREDLYYRLNIFPIVVPSLRE
jgi:Nif-specific regulatory protein